MAAKSPRLSESEYLGATYPGVSPMVADIMDKIFTSRFFRDEVRKAVEFTFEDERNMYKRKIKALEDSINSLQQQISNQNNIIVEHNSSVGQMIYKFGTVMDEIQLSTDTISQVINTKLGNLEDKYNELVLHTHDHEVSINTLETLMATTIEEDKDKVNASFQDIYQQIDALKVSIQNETCSKHQMNNTLIDNKSRIKLNIHDCDQPECSSSNNIQSQSTVLPLHYPNDTVSPSDDSIHTISTHHTSNTSLSSHPMAPMKSVHYVPSTPYNLTLSSKSLNITPTSTTQDILHSPNSKTSLSYSQLQDKDNEILKLRNALKTVYKLVQNAKNAAVEERQGYEIRIHQLETLLLQQYIVLDPST